MAVYVDNMQMQATVGRHSSKWSHLTADSPEELLEFAQKIGLRSSWIQYPGTWKEHFDLTEGKRQQALKNGAVAIDLYKSGQLMKERRERLTGEKP